MRLDGIGQWQFLSDDRAQGTVGKTSDESRVKAHTLLRGRIGEAHPLNGGIATHRCSRIDFDRSLIAWTAIADHDDPTAVRYDVQIIS